MNSGNNVDVVNIDEKLFEKTTRKSYNAGNNAATERKEGTEQQPPATVKMSSLAREYGKVIQMLNEEDEPREEAVNRGKRLIENWDGLRDEQIDSIVNKMTTGE